MPVRNSPDLSACEREPIHVPGSIQPHGFLLVVDQTTGSILQSAGDAARLLAHSECVLGKTVQEVMGISVAYLLRQSETILLRDPAYLATIRPRGGREELTITGHQGNGVAIIEAEPAARSESAATTLASIRATTERVTGATDLGEACRLAAAEVRRITGYDRVLIYQFLPDGSGSVLAEVKDDHLLPFLNHRFPASDIPQQARDLYRRSAIRVIPNVGYKPAPLLPVLCPTTSRPLDMSHCILRSVSPVHIRYLQNMNVGASMSVSLLRRGELWGLIACHNSTAKIVPYETQEACRHVGQVLSQQIRVREEADVHRVSHELGAARDEVLRALGAADNSGAALLDLCAELQSVVPSNGIAVCWKGAVASAGHVPSAARVSQLAAWLNRRAANAELFVTDSLAKEYPQAAAFASHASGLLSIVLHVEEPAVLMWFRAEQIAEIKWAGNPNEPVEPKSPLDALNPRKSFATWAETERGHCRPWGVADIESVRMFLPRAAVVLQQQKLRELNHLLQEANGQLSALASTDGLTGVANRRAYDECLLKEWARVGRTGRPLAVIILDLDFFKQYNDHFGHLAGDECLKQVARVLQANRRPTDLAARIGGEEFSLVLPDTNLKGAIVVAESVRSRIEDLHRDHPKSPMGFVTVSCGIATSTARKKGTVQDLLLRADQALYDAKKTGRNRVASRDAGCRSKLSAGHRNA
jgi:chemotaxis family two-component system sensor kinase Cph1